MRVKKVVQSDAHRHIAKGHVRYDDCPDKKLHFFYDTQNYSCLIRTRAVVGRRLRHNFTAVGIRITNSIGGDARGTPYSFSPPTFLTADSVTTTPNFRARR